MLKYTYFAQFQCVCVGSFSKKIELLETAIIFWVVFNVENVLQFSRR